MKGHVRQRSPGRFAIILDMYDAASGKRRRKWHSFKGNESVRRRSSAPDLFRIFREARIWSQTRAR